MKKDGVDDKLAISGIKEAQILMNEFSKSSSILITAFGKAGDPFLCHAFNVEDYEIDKIPGEKFMGVIVYFSLDLLYEFLRPKTTERRILRILNRTLKIIHHEITCLKGKLYSNDLYSYYAIWRFEDDFNEKGAGGGMGGEDKKNYFKSKFSAKAEVAFSALFIAIFKIKIFIREYMHIKHNKINMKAEHTVSFILHAGTGFEGAEGSDEKVDLVVLGKDLRLAKELSPHSIFYKSDILVTEHAYSLLSTEVSRAHQDKGKIPL